MSARVAGLYVFQGTNVNSVEAMEQLTQWELEADLVGMDAQLETDSIRIKVPGLHQAHASLSFKGEAGVTYYAELRVNGARIGAGIFAGITVSTADYLYHLSLIGAGNLNEDDLVSVYVGSNKSGGANFQLVYGQFGVFSS